MKKFFSFIVFLMLLVLPVSFMPLANAQEEMDDMQQASDDPLNEDTAANEEADKKEQVDKTKASAKKASKKSSKSTKKQNKKKTSKKKTKKAKEKTIYVDEYKFRTSDYDFEDVSYKFDRNGNPIISKKAGDYQARQFGKDYSKAYINTGRKVQKNYGKPRAFDDNTVQKQTSELTLPDGIGQPNGLIAIDPIIEPSR